MNAMRLSRIGALMSLFTLTVAVGLYLILGGCFLSDAEHTLGAGDFNVVDPYIRIFARPINSETRHYFTIFGAYTAYVLVLSILHLRGLI
jgi:hypothetical protein